jgi:hypothetical protein
VTLAGWVMLGVAWCSILALTAWCLARVLTGDGLEGPEEAAERVPPTA